MNRQEEINKMAKEIASFITSDKDVQVAFADALIRGAEWADAHPRWISVEDELPKETINNNVTDMVMTFSADGYIRLDRYMHYHHKWVNGASEVTHWMPLPEPPKKGGEE